MEEKINNIIEKIDTLHLEDPKIYDYWDEMASVLSSNKRETLLYLYHLNDPNTVLNISSVFEEMAIAFKTQDIICCFKYLQEKFPHLPLNASVEVASAIINHEK